MEGGDFHICYGNIEDPVKNCFNVCLKTLNVSIFFTSFFPLFHKITPVYSKEHLRELVLALEKQFSCIAKSS